MSKIKVGDEVMLVWGCCSEARRRHVGKTGVVQSIGQDITECPHCPRSYDGIHAFLTCPLGSGRPPLAWLVKLEPPAEQEVVEQREEIPA